MFSRTSKGFTLVELLIVVAILGILAVFLFPALLAGRSRARMVQCQSNLRQLSNAFTLYLGDWDEVFPAPGGLYGERNYWDQGSARGLDAYLRNRQGQQSVWVCPELTYWESRWEPRSYSMNTFLRDPPDVEPWNEASRILEGIALSAIPYPAQTILLFEGIQHLTANPNNGLGYVFRDGDYTLVRGYYRTPREEYLLGDRPWHRDRNNYLFVDGHLLSRPPELREPERPHRGNNYWYIRKER